MIQLKTPVIIDPISQKLDFGHQVCSFGSCFSDTIGSYLKESGYTININPMGTLYNPLSIASSIGRLMSGASFSKVELFYHNGLYSSWMHHGRFSHYDPDEALAVINCSFNAGVQALQQADYIMITWGTAYVYRLKDESDQKNRVVANCHKMPEKMFKRSMVSVEELLFVWTELIQRLLNINSKIRFVFTVSPIRHLRDGAHANMLSKSTLFLFNEALIQTFPDNCFYFPAYEIVHDELRDYRFYADDMTHPAVITEKIIAERISDVWLDTKNIKASALLRNCLQTIRHKPLHQDNPERALTLERIKHQLLALKQRFPAIVIPEDALTILELC